MKIYTRNLETEARRLMQRSPVVAIVGPRQVGKTTLAQTIIQNLPKPVRFFDLEYPEDWAALQEPAQLLERLETHTVVIDEVQRHPDLFPVLRTLVDRRREPGRFVLLGSVSPALIESTSESLAGRIAYLELHPFSVAELPDGTDWQDLWVRGGFPDSLFAESGSDSFEWRLNFVRTYLERDFRLLGLQAEPVLLRRFWTMLAHLNGQILKMDSLSTALGSSVATVKRYLNLFEAAYLTTRLQSFSANISKRLVKMPKLYLRDSGVLHYLLNIPTYEGLLGNPAIGASWEAFVLQQLKFHLPVGHEIFFYRTHNGAEADFVIAEAGRPKIMLEATFSSTPGVSKGFHICRQDLGTSKHFVVAPVKSPFPLKDGIEVIGPKNVPLIFH